MENGGRDRARRLQYKFSDEIIQLEYMMHVWFFVSHSEECITASQMFSWYLLQTSVWGEERGGVMSRSRNLYSFYPIQYVCKLLIFCPSGLRRRVKTWASVGVPLLDTGIWAAWIVTGHIQLLLNRQTARSESEADSAPNSAASRTFLSQLENKVRRIQRQTPLLAGNSIHS